ncbi:MAG: acyl-CoA dehydrogenase family protein [Candidatus Binatus sp.]|uniref:acyl-CoA dehydrogenase family protein n=1 Tax=Candidatus Binatus sp. TaxID=2811406 RepID=UPI00271733D8|nr:acyl-CoA dehydrogenase family protein [Candidatus Binatus sp.]MDO8432352.1 acyl-CoA dehydrogenase family protein [Candidatus Binatus sp.]
MDFKFSAEDEAFRSEFHSWLQANLPKRQEAEHDTDFMREGTAEDWKKRLEWHQKMHAGGWVGISWPKEYGGRGATLTQQIIYNEELSKVNSPALVNGLGIMLVGPTIIHWGTEEQKQRYVPKILSADELWCQGYSEPGAGSDVAGLQTRAVEEGDYFIINGQKVWTSDAHHADMCILLVRTDPDAPKHKGISYVLVDMHSPGVTVRPLVQITGDANFNEVFFEDVKAPKKNLIGEKNQGWQVAITTLMFERSGIGGGRDLMGQVREIAELAKAVPANGHSAWEDDSVRQKLGQFACEAAALRYTGFRQLTRRLKGLPPGPEGSVLKLGVSELNLRMNKFAMELLGPYSQMEFHAPHAIDNGKWSYRMLASRALTIAGGTSEIQHNIIGERVLGLPKG